MMRQWFKCSSRKNRQVPVLGALWRAGAGCVEKGLWPPKFRSHNMGLCDVSSGGWGGGQILGRGWVDFR